MRISQADESSRQDKARRLAAAMSAGRSAQQDRRCFGNRPHWWTSRSWRARKPRYKNHRRH